MRKVIPAILCLTLISIIILTGCSQETSAADTSVSTQVVKNGNLTIGLYADGRITLPVTNLNFEVSGTVKSIHVTPDQVVNAGDLLAELDDTDLQIAMDNAQTTLEKTETAYNDAVRQQDYSIESEKLKRDSLYKEYTAITFDVAPYQQAIEEGQSQVTQAQTEVEVAQKAYDDAVAAAASEETLQGLQEQIDKAAQSLSTATATLEKATQDLADAQDKYDKEKAAAKTAYELQKIKYNSVVESITAITNAELNMQEAENKLAEAENNLERVKLYAPESGKVINTAYKVGELVTAKTSTTASGTTSSSSDFITLLDQSAIYLSVNVTEGDIPGIETGQTMRVAVDSLGVENLMGTVTAISKIPEIDNAGIVTYEVTGVLDKYEESIMDGMSCFVTFVKKEKTNVLLVPNKAVFVEEGKQYVTVQLADGTTEKRQVVCGLSNGIQSEVIQGLAAGDAVVIGGLS